MTAEPDYKYEDLRHELLFSPRRKILDRACDLILALKKEVISLREAIRAIISELPEVEERFAHAVVDYLVEIGVLKSAPAIHSFNEDDEFFQLVNTPA